MLTSLIELTIGALLTGSFIHNSLHISLSLYSVNYNLTNDLDFTDNVEIAVK